MLETRLTERRFVTGDDYSIADMMIFPWAKGGLGFLEKAATNRLPPLDATRTWIDRVSSRPAVQRALERIAALARKAT